MVFKHCLGNLKTHCSHPPTKPRKEALILAQGCARFAQAPRKWRVPNGTRCSYGRVPALDFRGQNAHVQNKGKIPIRSCGVLSWEGIRDAQGAPKGPSRRSERTTGARDDPMGATRWSKMATEPCWLSRGDAQGTPKGPSRRPEGTTQGLEMTHGSSKMVQDFSGRHKAFHMALRQPKSRCAFCNQIGPKLLFDV